MKTKKQIEKERNMFAWQYTRRNNIYHRRTDRLPALFIYIVLAGILLYLLWLWLGVI